jgi:hypothetical protein
MTLWGYALLWFLTPFDAHGKAPATKLIDALGNLFNKERVPTGQV